MAKLIWVGGVGDPRKQVWSIGLLVAPPVLALAEFYSVGSRQVQLSLSELAPCCGAAVFETLEDGVRCSECQAEQKQWEGRPPLILWSEEKGYASRQAVTDRVTSWLEVYSDESLLAQVVTAGRIADELLELSMEVPSPGSHQVPGNLQIRHLMGALPQLAARELEALGVHRG